MSDFHPDNPSGEPLPASRLTPAVRMGLSIAVATGLYGISFGALAVAAGLSVGQTLVLSLLFGLVRREFFRVCGNFKRHGLRAHAGHVGDGEEVTQG